LKKTQLPSSAVWDVFGPRPVPRADRWRCRSDRSRCRFFAA
jgi:hypothetical protein